jgi:thiosulfate dehydrogenase [quinone] large subunit
MAKANKQQKNSQAMKIWGLTRISLGFVFLWAFFDKLFGLGFATCRDAATNTVNVMCDSAWLAGGSPTKGFLSFGTTGPFAEFYQSLAGNTLVDWTFMIGLLGIGLALILGIGMKIATYSGALMMILMYTAVLPASNNPIIDDHIVYALVLLGLLAQNDGQRYGFAKQWSKQPIVKQYPWLQ